jgi:hypothetical protein
MMALVGFLTNPLQKCDGRFTGTKLVFCPYLGAQLRFFILFLLEELKFVDWHPLKALISPCDSRHQSCAGALALFNEPD